MIERASGHGRQSMGFLDRFRRKTTDVVDDHGEKIGEGIDKAADVADDKTGGKYSQQIDSGADKAKDTLDSLDGKDDDIADKPSAPPPAQAP
jgi:MT0933-like antitoxin protein